MNYYYISAIVLLSSAFAIAAPNTKANSKVLLNSNQNNGSYLNEVHAPNETPIKAVLFDSKVMDEMKEKFKVMNGAYEHKKNYGLDDTTDRINYQRANQDLMKWAMRKLVQFHVQRQVQNTLKQAEQKSEAVRNVKQTVEVAQKAVAVIQNTSFKLNAETKARVKYDFPTGVASASLTSAIIDTNLDYKLKPFIPNLENPTQVGKPTAAQDDIHEKLVFGMSKNLSEIGLSTGVNYGFTKRTVNIGVNKHIVGPLSAQLDQANKLGQSSQNEIVGRLNLGTNF